MFLGKVLPPAGGLTPAGMQVLGIFAGVLIMWLTIAIHWPSLLGIAMLATVPGLSLNKLLAISVGNSTFSFLLFTFMCTYALSKTPFVKRCAIGFICSRIARKGSWWFLISYCASVLIIGMFMSPVVLFVIYLPILDAICEELQLRNEDTLTNSLVLGQLICAEMACGMTPIAHVFPIMAFYGVGLLQCGNRKKHSLWGLYVVRSSSWRDLFYRFDVDFPLRTASRYV